MTVSVSPLYPLAGQEITVSQTFAISEADFVDASRVVLNILSVPPGSTVETGIVVDDDGSPISTFTGDVPGDYEVQSVAYAEYAAPALYGDDATSFTTSAQEVAETATVSVGVQMDLRIRTIFGDSVTLRIGVIGQTVRTAELVSPVGIAATNAITSESVTDALATLIGELASEFGPSLDGALSALADAYNAHRVQGTIHATDDVTNVYRQTLPRSPQDNVRQVNLLRAMLSAHMLNGSVASATWHSEDDTKNTPIVPAASTLADAVVLYADCARCYEAHRVQISSPDSHGSADSTNVLGTLDPLTLLLIEILEFIATSNPTAPDGASVGRLQLAARYGMKEVA